MGYVTYSPVVRSPRKTTQSPLPLKQRSPHITITLKLQYFVFLHDVIFHDIRLLRILQKAKTFMIQWTLSIWNKGFAQTVPCIIMITIKKTRIIKHDIMNRDDLAT